MRPKRRSISFPNRLRCLVLSPNRWMERPAPPACSTHATPPPGDCRHHTTDRAHVGSFSSTRRHAAACRCTSSTSRHRRRNSCVVYAVGFVRSPELRDQSRHVRRTFTTYFAAKVRRAIHHYRRRRRRRRRVRGPVVFPFCRPVSLAEHGQEPCAVDEDAELPVPELAEQIVQAQHHHVHQHVFVHDFRAGHADQRENHARVHARRKSCAHHFVSPLTLLLLLLFRLPDAPTG